MSTQQDIYTAGSENRPPMLNKENYVPWSSRLLRYAKSRPNGKLIHNSIINGPYVRRMIPEPGDTNREVPVNETFHVQTDDEFTEKELKQIEADDQAIQTILLGLPEDIYAAVDSSPHQDQLSFNQNYMQQTMPNPEDITDLITAMNMALALMAKAFKLNYSTPTNNNQRILSNPHHRQIAQPGMNIGQDRQMQMVGAQNPRVQNIGNQNGLIGVPGNANQNLNGNGNLEAARAEGNAAGHNGNQIRCYNYRGVGHFARNCTVRPRRRDAAYLQTQLLIAQKEEAGIQIQAEEFDLMAPAADLDEIEEVNTNYILMANLQQASTSGTQTDKSPVYDSDGSAEVHNYEDCYDNEIFNMFTQEEQYTELLEPIPESHQVPQNDNDVTSKVTSMEQTGSESRPPMLNKENYVPWSFRLLRYAKSKPNGKLIHNSILNGPYVKKMIPEPGDANRDITVTETFLLQTDDKLSDKELKHIEADDQAIQTILLGLPEDIYAAVDSCETAQEIWLRVQQMMKGSDIGIQEKKAKLCNLIGVQGNGNQNQIGNGNLVAAHAEENAAGKNGNQIRCYNCRGNDSAPVYDTYGSAEVHDNCDDNEIFNMFTQEEQYTELLEPIPESHQVAQTYNDVISEDTSVEQGGETVEQHPVNFEETRALYESLYQNLAIEVEKVKSVNRKLKETNANMTTELARNKNQERCFEISQEKYDKLERCYQQSVYHKQCLSKKINALHLSFGKQIMTLNEQISELNKQLSKEKSTVSFLLEEKKRLKSDFKTYEDKLLDKQILLEKGIKELNNIVLKTGQSIQTIHMLSPQPNSFYHTEQKMALGYQNPFYLKQAQKKQQSYQNPFYLKQAQKKQQSLYDGKVLLEKHDPPIAHDSEETLQLAQESRDKMKQMNKEIKPANYTKINHLSGAKFVADFKSLTNEADASLAKHKALELEIEHLLNAVVSQDIMIIVQNESVIDTSDLQSLLERTIERFENCIIKKENEYAKLWND
nr:hypothetical protein [Tanacetum cinerariifolium]